MQYITLKDLKKNKWQKMFKWTGVNKKIICHLNTGSGGEILFAIQNMPNRSATLWTLYTHPILLL